MLVQQLKTLDHGLTSGGPLLCAGVDLKEYVHCVKNVFYAVSYQPATYRTMSQPCQILLECIEFLLFLKYNTMGENPAFPIFGRSLVGTRP